MRPRQASSRPGCVSPPPMKIADGGAQRRRTHRAPSPAHLDAGAEARCALSTIRSRRCSSRSNATARQPDPLRHHSIAMLPEPAPTSHSSSPGRGASAASVTRPHRLLGDLPVVGERSSGSAANRARRAGSAPRSTLSASTSPGGRAAHSRAVAVAAPLGRAAELFEHRDLRIAAAGLGEQPRQRRRAGAVARHHDRLAATAHRGVRLGGDEADDLGVLHRPADPRARQRHRRHVRQHRHLVRRRTAGSACRRRRAAAGRRWPPRACRHRHRRAACAARAASATATAGARAVDAVVQQVELPL